MTYATFLIRKSKKDIATFEHYKPTWDKIVLDIISTNVIDVFSIQEYFDPNDNEWEMFLNVLSYFNYIDFPYPNLSVESGSNYATRKVLISQDQFKNIIKCRDITNRLLVTYDMVLQRLNANLIYKIKQLLPLKNDNGQSLTTEQENTIYNTISKDLVYATQSDTHFTLDTLESYCSTHSLQNNKSYCCKIYEFDDINKLKIPLPASCLMFGCCKTTDFYTSLLDIVAKNNSIEIFSLSNNSNIKNNYQIITIYPM